MNGLFIVHETNSIKVLYNKRMDCLQVIKAQGSFTTNSLYTKEFKPMSNQPRLTKTEYEDLKPIVIEKLKEFDLFNEQENL